MKIIDCRNCIYYFEIRVGYFNKEMIRIDSYCKQGVNLIGISNGGIIECPLYKPKTNWNKINNRIIESEKDRERIKKRRERGK